MKIFILFFMLCVFCISSPSVMAQDDPTIKPLPSFLDDIGKAEDLPVETVEEPIPAPDIAAPIEEMPKSDMSDIPDEFIIEASKYGEDCRNHHEMPLYYDCRCLGVKYLDKRIELGPDASVSAIRNQLGKACKDGTGIAGQIYEQCLNDFFEPPENVGPEEYCSCYGNSFAKLFEEWPGQLFPRVRIALLSKAQLVCQDPVAARRVYGTRANIP